MCVTLLIKTITSTFFLTKAHTLFSFCFYDLISDTVSLEVALISMSCVLACLLVLYVSLYQIQPTHSETGLCEMDCKRGCFFVREKWNATTVPPVQILLWLRLFMALYTSVIETNSTLRSKDHHRHAHLRASTLASSSFISSRSNPKLYEAGRRSFTYTGTIMHKFLTAKNRADQSPPAMD
jgi:hypothetical protein